MTETSSPRPMSRRERWLFARRARLNAGAVVVGTPQPARPVDVLVTCRGERAQKIADLFRRLGLRAETHRRRPDLVDAPSVAHLYWGTRHFHGSRVGRANSYGMENAWLPQREGFYMDPKGLNGGSNIAGGTAAIPEPDCAEIDAWVADLHRRMNVDVRPPDAPAGPFLFVPLQLERDSTIRTWSRVPARRGQRVRAFVAMVCRIFPGTPLVIRRHPLDKSAVPSDLPEVRAHGRVTFSQSASSWQWIAASAGVVGINSTVLIEAATFYRRGIPVCAFGDGVFTDNAALIEARGNPDWMRYVLDRSKRPEVGNVRRFLSLLRRRAIPYNLTADHLADHPELADFVNRLRGRNQSVSISPQPPLSGAALYEHVHAARRYHYKALQPRHLAAAEAIQTLPEADATHGFSVLDVGCGVGHFVKLLLDRGFDARGVDLVYPDDMLFPLNRFIRATATVLPYGADCFDCVTALDVLEHLTDAELPAAISELRRVSSRWIVLSLGIGSHTAPGPDGRDIELHLQQMNVSDWQRTLEAHGLRMVRPPQIINRRTQQNVFVCEKERP